MCLNCITILYFGLPSEGRGLLVRIGPGHPPSPSTDLGFQKIRATNPPLPDSGRGECKYRFATLDSPTGGVCGWTAGRWGGRVRGVGVELSADNMHHLRSDHWLSGSWYIIQLHLSQKAFGPVGDQPAAAPSARSQMETWSMKQSLLKVKT